MSTTTETKKKITISLSDRPPVTIDPEAWPIIASAYWRDGQVRCQANRTASIKVREHEDGRRIVYGHYESAFPKERDQHAGFLLDKPIALGPPPQDGSEETVRAIRRVAGVVCEELGDEVIADLPAVELV